MARELRMGFNIFEWLKKNQKKYNIFDPWKRCETEISVSTNEVLLECSLTQFICILSRAAFKQQWQRWVIVTETPKARNIYCLAPYRRKRKGGRETEYLGKKIVAWKQPKFD